jgi:asparagine synthase (glutamine-hydrolysing)
MSSIFGIVQFDQRPIDPANLQIMQEKLNHWNADDKNIWHNGSVGLGHLMLYNTPESLEERLPLHDALSELTITADARIDNRDELFEKLGIEHSLRKAMPDSTLILIAYQKYRGECVKYLIGDFAFAIWDEKEHQLFCARDHMGVKPFFYYKCDSFFAFATEKKGILDLPNIDTSIDRLFLYRYLVTSWEQDSDTTLYEKIKRIPPASALTLYSDKNQITLSRYWTLDAYKEIKLDSIEDYYEQLLYHFDEAVKCRTRTAFPIGAELSGGMDSSAITGAANNFLKQNNQYLITFSNTLPDGITDEKFLELDERKYIDAVIDFNKIEEYVYVTKDIWDNRLDEIDFSLYVDDGIESWKSLWLLPIKKAAMERNARTILSGFPGDQMVTTLSKTYFLDYLHNKQYRKYFLAVSEYKEPFSILLPFLPQKLKFLLYNIRNLTGRYNKAILDASTIYNIPENYKKRIRNFIWHDPVFQEINKSYKHFQKYMLLQPRISHRLESETRSGLYFRIEPRFPMADIRLTQFFSAMPNELKYGGSLRRNTYRNSVRKYLPFIILQRDTKYGSVAPFLQFQKTKIVNDVELLFQELPENSIIKNEIIEKHIKHLSQKRFSNKKKNKCLLPSLELMRWIQKGKVL